MPEPRQPLPLPPPRHISPLRISSFFASPPIRVTPPPRSPSPSNPPILASGLKINCARNARSCTRIYLPRDVFILPLNIFHRAPLPRKIGRIFKFRFEDRVTDESSISSSLSLSPFFLYSLKTRNLLSLSMNRTTSFFSPSNSNIHVIRDDKGSIISWFPSQSDLNRRIKESLSWVTIVN